MSLKENIKKLEDKLDKKALLGAIVLMLMSWAALPIIYLMLRKKHKKDKEVNNKDGDTK